MAFMFAFAIALSTTTPTTTTRHGMQCGTPQPLATDAVQTVRFCTVSRGNPAAKNH